MNLQLEEGIYEEFIRKFGEPHIPVSDYEVLDELERLVSQISSEVHSISGKSCFQCTLGGTLPDDRKRILSLIEGLKSVQNFSSQKFYGDFEPRSVIN